MMYVVVENLPHLARVTTFKAAPKRLRGGGSFKVVYLVYPMKPLIANCQTKILQNLRYEAREDDRFYFSLIDLNFLEEEY